MSRLVDFYATQVRILWEWRGGFRSLAKRLVITLLVSTVALLLTAGLLPGVSIGRFLDAVIAVVLMALFNAIVRPVLLTLVAPRSLVLLGILVIVLQILTFLVIAPLSPGVEVDGLVSALIGSFVYAAFNTALTSILGVDRGGSYFGLLVSSLMAKRWRRRIGRDS
jgi:putative membrane protein